MSSRWIGTCLSAAAILLLSTTIHAQSTQQHAGSVSGTVTAGGEGVIKVHLRTLQENPLQAYDGYEVLADATGHFHFIDIQPGSYTLEAESQTAHAVTLETVTVYPGKVSANHMVALIPKPMLCGRITYGGRPRPRQLELHHYNPELGN